MDGGEQAEKRHSWHLEVEQVLSETAPTGCITQRVGKSPDSCRRWECGSRAHRLRIAANMMDA